MTARRLRILYIADANSVHTQRWVGWFARRHDVRVVHVSPLDPSSDARLLPLSPGQPGHRLPVVSLARIVHHVRKQVASFRPDFVHAHFLTPNAWIAAASGSPRVVTTTWGSDLLLAGKLTRGLHRLSLSRAVLNTVDSQDAALRLGELLGGSESIRVIQFGVDTDAFSPAPASGALRAQWQIPAGKRIALSPRILRPLYNAETVARAFVALAPRHPDLHLVFLAYHADPEYQRAVERELRAAGVLDRVRFVPGVPYAAMPDLYREAVVVLSVPSSDTTSTTLLEAMACGSVAVASDLPSVREWVQHGSTGFLAPAAEVVPLVAVIERVLGLSEAERAAITGASRTLVIERGSQHAEMTRLEQELSRRLPAAAGH